MPPEDIDVTDHGIVKDEQEPDDPKEWVDRVGKRNGRGEIDVSNTGITEPLNDHHPGVEKSAEDAETVEDRIVKSEQRQRDRMFQKWSAGSDDSTEEGLSA